MRLPGCKTRGDGPYEPRYQRNMLTVVERLIRQVEGDPTGGKCEQKFHGVRIAGILASFRQGKLAVRESLNAKN